MRRLRPAALAWIGAAALASAAGRPALPATPGRQAGAATPLASHGSGVDLAVVTRIRDEGLHRSQVLATAAYLSDRIGPRLTGTPELKEANEWTRRQLADWGLANAHLEAWGPFGRGWSFSRAVVTMVEPRQVQLAALPKAWTPGTPGEVRGEAMRVTIDGEADLARYRGKLAGRIVLLDKAHDLSAEGSAVSPRRFTPEGLAELAAFDVGAAATPADRQARRQRFRWRGQVRKFLFEEKALASIEVSPLPWGVIRVGSGGNYKEGEPPVVTGLVMAAEDYNRLVRLLDAGQKVELSIDLQARYHSGDAMAYNTVAELPGSDPRGEVVMAGAHLDSWHAGTGATDDAAGCAVAMEAVRILAALHLRPRRTIRVALWTGEEEGLLGSTAYVARHFAARPPAPPAPAGEPALPVWMEEPSGQLSFKPEYAQLSGYFNVDNGSGRIRGITAQENVAAQPLFAAWLAPLADLGATTVSLRSVGATDHVSFDRVGLPGFQFIQDELDYSSHTHHTNADVADHLDGNDLIQASVVLASVLYDAANLSELLPRKPLPPAPPPATRPR